MGKLTSSQWSGETDSWPSLLEFVFRYGAMSWPVTWLVVMLAACIEMS